MLGLADLPLQQLLNQEDLAQRYKRLSWNNLMAAYSLQSVEDVLLSVSKDHRKNSRHEK
jgi:hypothetical protein